MQLTRRHLLAHSAALPLWPLAGLGLTACSTVETTSVQSRLRGKSITVISTIGTTLRLTWRGTTLFNNEFGEAFVPDWGYKEQLENRTVELLRASGRFSSVQRVTITATRREEALKELKELKTPTDHVLLISGAPSADSIWATREGFFGLGIAQRSILQLGTESVAHASLRVDLLVPSTFGTVLGEATVDTGIDGGEGVVFIDGDVGFYHSDILIAAMRCVKYCISRLYPPGYPASFVKTCKGKVPTMGAFAGYCWLKCECAVLSGVRYS